LLPDIKTVELFRMGSLHISPFGVLAATGILAGRALALHRAKQAGIPREDMDDALLYTLLSAFFLRTLPKLFLSSRSDCPAGACLFAEVLAGAQFFRRFFRRALRFLCFSFIKGKFARPCFTPSASFKDWSGMGFRQISAARLFFDLSRHI